MKLKKKHLGRPTKFRSVKYNQISFIVLIVLICVLYSYLHRGRRIRDHHYQPGRVTGSRSLPKRHTNDGVDYIEWSSDEGDSDEEQQNICK